MVPAHLWTIWSDLQRLLADARADDAAASLRMFASGPPELLRQMQDELVQAIEHPCLSGRRDELYAEFARGSGYPLHQPGWPVQTVRRGGRQIRTTRNARGEVVEICALDARGQPEVPHLSLDPVRQLGHVRFRSSEDSFGGGRALAMTAFGDEPLEAEMTYEQWRDAMLRWFDDWLRDV
jgi:hypothetical protein